MERGLDSGLGLVSLNDAIVESEVSRASAYRAYAGDDADPQVAFRAELLVTYIREDPLEERRRTAELISSETLKVIDTDDPVQLVHGVREILRLSYAGRIHSLADDPDWKIVGPSWAATALSDHAPRELVDAHRDGVVASAMYYVPLFQQMAVLGGLRLRAGLDWRTYALLSTSTVITASFFAGYHPELRAIMRPTGPGGELRPWSHAAVLVEGLVLSSFEPDPDAAASVDLGLWLARPDPADPDRPGPD